MYVLHIIILFILTHKIILNHPQYKVFIFYTKSFTLLLFDLLISYIILNNHDNIGIYYYYIIQKN